MMTALAAAQFVVLLRNGDVAAGVHSTIAQRFQNVRYQLYSGETQFPSLGILASSPTVDPEQRLEHLFPDVLARAPSGVDWFIFTHSDTWWHLPNLESELQRIESNLAPAAPTRDILVVGGGGYLVFSCFLILSKPALAYLSNGTVLDACRKELRECRPYKHRMPNEFAHMVAVGCHHSGPGSGRKTPRYKAAALVNYCAAEPLATGQCGSKEVGCEWRFGELARDPPGPGPPGTPSPNEMARRRFRQNHARRSRVRPSERERAPGLPEECAPVMCALVAYEHADNETQAWFDAMVRTQREGQCCDAKFGFGAYAPRYPQGLLSSRNPLIRD